MRRSFISLAAFLVNVMQTMDSGSCPLATWAGEEGRGYGFEGRQEAAVTYESELESSGGWSRQKAVRARDKSAQTQAELRGYEGRGGGREGVGRGREWEGRVGAPGGRRGW